MGSRARLWFAAAAALLGIAGFGLPPAAHAQTLEISAQPALFPAFDTAVTDYVTRCTPGTPVAVTVAAPAGASVDVDGQGPRGGSFTTSVGLTAAGQGFAITATSGPGNSTYHVRCIPSDFPAWTFQRSGQPQAEWYALGATVRTDFQPVPPSISQNYVALFDRNGVPVWWLKSAEQSIDFHPFSNGNVVWAHLSGASSEEHRLDGSLVRTITGVGTGIRTDAHETLRLENGNYLFNAWRVVQHMNFCGLVDKPILDNGLQEVTPGGAVVRQWFASQSIPMTEVPPAWCNTIVNAPVNGNYDVYHVNSAEADGDDVLLSFRHLDAVYSVNPSAGTVEWKLGGTPRAESLTIVGGGGFGGQHDARVLGDGTVTVHDNAFHPGAAGTPRAVRYAIDTSAGTATLVEQKNDPDALPAAVCCGSARRLPGGNWVISWGSTGVITELSPAGSRVFKLTFDDSLFSYRVHPVPFGQLSSAALRAGMDAQFPRGYARPKAVGQVRVPLVPAYSPCASPDRTHGPPLAFGSCSSPAQTSGQLTVGTIDANGAASNATGSVSFQGRLGDPTTPANEADVTLGATLTDVRRRSDLTDYAGELQLRLPVRITDRLNGPLQNEAATGLDTELPATIPCTPTAAAGVGSTCSLATSINALVPGAIVERKRAIWELGAVQVFDGGATGVAGSSGARPFQTQGIFVP